MSNTQKESEIGQHSEETSNTEGDEVLAGEKQLDLRALHREVQAAEERARRLGTAAARQELDAAITRFAKAYREFEAKKQRALRKSEELLALLQRGRYFVPLNALGVDLSKHLRSGGFTERRAFTLIPPMEDQPTQPKRAGFITEIILRDWRTGEELHTYVCGPKEDWARGIEEKVLVIRDMPEEYKSYFIVVFAAFAQENVRGKQLRELINEVAWLYADHDGISRYSKDHERARRKIKKWLRRNLGGLVGCRPNELEDYPPLPMPGWFFLSPDSPLRAPPETPKAPD
jgi:hypothetical protein